MRMWKKLTKVRKRADLGMRMRKKSEPGKSSVLGMRMCMTKARKCADLSVSM
jgi:hypothetical protein